MLEYSAGFHHARGHVALTFQCLNLHAQSCRPNPAQLEVDRLLNSLTADILKLASTTITSVSVIRMRTTRSLTCEDTGAHSKDMSSCTLTTQVLQLVVLGREWVVADVLPLLWVPTLVVSPGLALH